MEKPSLSLSLSLALSLSLRLYVSLSLFLLFVLVLFSLVFGPLLFVRIQKDFTGNSLFAILFFVLPITLSIDLN